MALRSYICYSLVSKWHIICVSRMRIVSSLKNSPVCILVYMWCHSLHIYIGLVAEKWWKFYIWKISETKLLKWILHATKPCLNLIFLGPLKRDMVFLLVLIWVIYFYLHLKYNRCMFNSRLCNSINIIFNRCLSLSDIRFSDLLD